jgi:hypothetical protein
VLQVCGLSQILVSYSQFCYVVLCINYVKLMVNTCGSYVNWLEIVRKLC